MVFFGFDQRLSFPTAGQGSHDSGNEVDENLELYLNVKGLKVAEDQTETSSSKSHLNEQGEIRRRKLPISQKGTIPTSFGSITPITGKLTSIL